MNNNWLQQQLNFTMVFRLNSMGFVYLKIGFIGKNNS